MQVKTIPVEFLDRQDQSRYLEAVERVRIGAADDMGKRKSRLIRAYKAGLCPQAMHIIRATQERTVAALWHNELDLHGYPNAVPLRGDRALLPERAEHAVFGEEAVPPTENWSNMTKRDILSRMMRGSPKLRWLEDRLRRLKENASERILIWCSRPISQWLITLIGYS